MIKSKTSERKKEHIEICLSDKIIYEKSNGFENYEFPHCAITEVDLNKIDLTTKFFNKKINLPFLISCMTGGTNEAEKINEKLAIVASDLNIPIGLGSQRQALENKNLLHTYKIVRENAKNVPLLGNIGAAQIASSNKIVDEIKYLTDLVDADVMVIHLNPLQELFQKEGEINFKGLLKNIEKLTNKINIPFIAKEVGSGISKDIAKKLLDVGIKGIDVAGSGGTSWAKVEMVRNNYFNNYFSNWGLPTSYCVRTVSKLKKNYKFVLISSGGINNGIDIAKSIALGADLSASARIILKELFENDIKGVINLINEWFDDVKKIMYLTGVKNLNELHKIKLIKKSELF
ncbi:MAG: type 2 isopentenyl-diphosphate Delta-isomerase [Melioribacteraceae bacterium]|nr:type 2 isopentenyl-diphosphate Delta-isomerase [Melioribacteraceae bacterium]